MSQNLKKKKKSFHHVITDEGSHIALQIYSFYQVTIISSSAFDGLFDHPDR